jgi:O-antigen biosynthesis protein
MGRSGLLFVGGFQHPPNLDAVLWFVHDIWPRILSQDREMVLRIVGSDLSEGIVSVLKQPGVEVLGYVPDLTGLFAYSRMSVAPLRYGAGVKGKVGQSIAFGLPVVTTKIGAEGMALEDGKHILIADEPEEFAAAVLRLATDDELWRRLQANGRDFIADSQSIDAVRGKLRALMNVYSFALHLRLREAARWHIAFTDGRQIPYRPNGERALADWRLLPHCMRPLLAHRDQFLMGT